MNIKKTILYFIYIILWCLKLIIYWDLILLWLSITDFWYIVVIYYTILQTNKNYDDKTFVKFALMNDTPYPALTGELWGVFRELY